MDCNKFSQVNYSPSLTQEKKKEIEEFIFSVNNNSVLPYACGDYKTVYLSDDFACAEEETALPPESTENFEKAMEVSEIINGLNIQTPKFLYTTSMPKHTQHGFLNYIYTVNDRVNGLPIWFPRRNFVTYFDYTGEKSHDYHSSELNEEWQKTNIGILKNRATKFKPAMPKFFRDFYILNSLGVFNDIHGGNILQDSFGNYSFIDLNYRKFPAEVKDMQSLSDYLLALAHADYSERNNDYFSREPRCVVERFFNSCLLDYSWHGLSISNIDYNYAINQFVYGGILFQQALQMLKSYSSRFTMDQFISKIELNKTYINFLDEHPRKFMSPLALKLLNETLESGKGNSSQLSSQIFSDIGYRSPSYFELIESVDFRNFIDYHEFSEAFKTLSSGSDFDFSYLSKDILGNSSAESSISQ